MSDATLWTAVGAIATGVSALVTAATAIFIARQTSATRRAAEAGEKTARVAVESLDVARKEQDRTLFLALEAVKTRIDNATPRITMTVADAIAWPPVVPSQFGDAQPHVSLEPFRLPRDGTSQLMVRLGITIRNEGARTIKLTFGKPLASPDTPSITRAVLGPGEALENRYVEIARSVAEWAAIHEERVGGSPGEEFKFEAIYLDDSDTGVIEYHEVIFGGSLLKPVANELGAWTLIDYSLPNNADSASIGWAIQPTKRRYFLSHLRGQELPEIELQA